MSWETALDRQIHDYLPDLKWAADEPMAKHTSFRIGGPAKRMAFPKTREQLVVLMGFLQDAGVKPLLIGNGTNLLVADDAVEITRIGSTLSGTAPELIRNYLEVRGVGVIDVEKLFGVGAVQDSTQIDLVIQFEKWEDDKFYDRLGLDENDTTILDVPVPQITIPVSAGRNLAAIVELAAMNNRQKKHGFNSAREFAAQIDGHIDRVTRENELKNQNP